MDALDIVAVDPADEATFDAWYDVYRAADVAGREDLAVPWRREECRVELARPTSATRHLAHLLRSDGVAVGAGHVQLSLLDNLGVAGIAVHTHPDHRRQGHGTRLLEHLVAVARRHGRSVLLGEVNYPYAGPPDGRGAPGAEFARARGFDLALGDVMRELTLPVPADLLDRLAAEAAPHHAAYSIRSFVGRIPDDLVQGWTEAGALVATDAPMGDLAIEADVASVRSTRENEAVLTAQRRTRYGTVALTAAGEVAAYTDVVVPEPDPDCGMQWGTLVRREHRGHRLGLAVKVANQRLLQEARSDVRRLVTYNAEVNDHMIGVNDRLGYRPVERLGEFQRRLPIGPTG